MASALAASLLVLATGPAPAIAATATAYEIIRLRANGVDKWAYDSPDDLDNDVQYSTKMNSTKTFASATEYVLFRAIFDTTGSDPSCNAYTDNV